MNTFIQRLLSNPHTSISALVWGLCKLGSVWLPQYKDKFDATEAIAVSYGLLMAGDASNSAKAHEETKQLVAGLDAKISATQTAVKTGDTSFIDKTVVAAQPKQP